MLKAYQILKGSRYISRSRNPNSLSSPAQVAHEENVETHKQRRPSKRPVTFTPSIFRSVDQKYRKGAQPIQEPAFFLSRGLPANGESDNFGNEQSENNGGRARPDHDHDEWYCRCRCRFGELVGYTSLVAASIHLCRIINHSHHHDKEQIEISRLDNNRGKWCARSTVLSHMKDKFQNGWQQFLMRAAPVLFPEVFKRWYVLPAIPQLKIASSNLGRLEHRSSNEEGKQSGDGVLFEESSPSSSSGPVSRTISTSDCDCAVQTDPEEIGSPFDKFMLESGRQLAAITRMSDVTLEHAIGVDLLKRRLYDEAIDYLLGAARSGHAGALYNVGICYSRGFGVRKDMTKAVEMWRSAADQGHGLSKYQMGVCHARGLGGLTMDHDRAMRYMQAAESAGVPEAKTYLAATEYKQGRLEGALELLRQAMAGGDEQAKSLLQEWPDKDSKTESGYVFENLAKVKVALPAPSAAIKRMEKGRRRFWASSSSDKEDSLSSSSSSHRKMSQNGHGSESSVVFGDEDSLECGNSKIDVIGSHAIETVASLLSLGSLRRSKTVPDFSAYEVAPVRTGKIGDI